MQRFSRFGAMCVAVMGLGLAQCVTVPDDDELRGNAVGQDEHAGGATDSAPVGPIGVSYGAIEGATTSVPLGAAPAPGAPRCAPQWTTAVPRTTAVPLTTAAPRLTTAVPAQPVCVPPKSTAVPIMPTTAAPWATTAGN